jgi:glycosyltransferase involved in cell wall biosynthesis
MPVDHTSTNIKVSVSLVTYNHENFIAQAIESILMQKVNFNYEIIIGEDCSDDKTRDIVTHYYHKYPDKIRLILPEKNLGCYGQKIFVQTLKACQGEYVALLDGDDYWNSIYKLQMQVDFLNKHSECAICCHDIRQYLEDTQKFARFNRFKPKRFSTIEDMLKCYFAHTSATMYRNGLFDEFPEWYESVMCGDWVLHILNAQYGKIGYIDKVMSIYRIHSQGIFSSMKTAEQIYESLKCYKYLNAYFKYKYADIIKAQEGCSYYELATIYKREGDLAKANQYANKCIKALFPIPYIRVVGISKLIRIIFMNNYYNLRWQVKQLFLKMLHDSST